MEELIAAAVSYSYSTQQNENKASDSELYRVSKRKTEPLVTRPALKIHRTEICKLHEGMFPEY